MALYLHGMQLYTMTRNVTVIGEQQLDALQACANQIPRGKRQDAKTMTAWHFLKCSHATYKYIRLKNNTTVSRTDDMCGLVVNTNSFSCIDPQVSLFLSY